MFCTLILLHFWPLLVLERIVTHDGAAHVYNSELILRILSGDNLVRDFISIKSFPEPNWSGHFILAVLQKFFSPILADKFFLSAYIIFLPFFFFKLIKKIKPENSYAAFLVIPFIFSNFFFLGVYNFLSGVVCLIAALSIVLPRMERGGLGNFVRILFFSLLLYFCHLLALGIFLIMIFIAQIFISTKKVKKSNTFSELFRTGLPVLIAVLPSLILVFFFFAGKSSIPVIIPDVQWSELFKFLFFIAPVCTLTDYPENIYAAVLFFLIIFLFAVVIKRKLSFNHEKKSSKEFYQTPAFWGSATLIMLIFYFIFPDSAATGGVVKLRFELFFYLMLIVFLSTFKAPAYSRLVTIIIISPWIVLKLVYLVPMMKTLDNDAHKIMEAAHQIEKGKTLLPLNYSSNWMHDNLFNYAGTINNIFILDNYEASSPHFPLTWKVDKDPNLILGNFNGYPPLCANINDFKLKTGHTIDYVALWNFYPSDDSCTKSILKILSSDYTLVNGEESDPKLYKRIGK